MSWDQQSDDPEALEREISKRRERGEPFEPVLCHTKRGSTSTSFWGTAWCDNLEAYSDMEFRLPRGRSYLRKGNVYDLTIDRGEVFAYVTGASIYEVLISVEPLAIEQWESVKSDCSGQVDSLLDLLAGKLGPSVLKRITNPEDGLFPSPDEIRLSCDCPDYADVCKHIAATIYAIGVRLDEDPSLFFKLRQIDHRELIEEAVQRAGTVTAVETKTPQGILAAEELSELFGIDLIDPESAFL